MELSEPLSLLFLVGLSVGRSCVKVKYVMAEVSFDGPAPFLFF